MKIYNEYISGFVDGLNTNIFIIKKKNYFFNKKKNYFVFKNEKNKTIYLFKISLNEKNIFFLYNLKKKFQCGFVKKKKNCKNFFFFFVNNKLNLQKNIIPFFIKYPLQSKNKIFFNTYVKLLYKNLNLKIIFNYLQNNNLIFNNNLIINISNDWFTGFVDCVGFFTIETKIVFANYIFKLKKNNVRSMRNVEDTCEISSLHKQNLNFFEKRNVSCKAKSKQVFFKTKFKFILNLNKYNVNLIYHIQKFVNCGYIVKNNLNNVFFVVCNLQHLIQNIFPKLYTKTSKHLLKTSKRILFEKFRKIVIMHSLNKHKIKKNKIKILKLKKYINNYQNNQ